MFFYLFVSLSSHSQLIEEVKYTLVYQNTDQRFLVLIFQEEPTRV